MTLMWLWRFLLVESFGQDCDVAIGFSCVLWEEFERSVLASSSFIS
jgi:hypothetical protein